MERLTSPPYDGGMTTYTTRSRIVATAAIVVTLLGGWLAGAQEAHPDRTGRPPAESPTDQTPPDATQGTKGNLGPGSAESSGYFGGTDATTYGGLPEIPFPWTPVEPMTPVR
jgi:hypothetical protein